jgi:hypothetical protein
MPDAQLTLDVDVAEYTPELPQDIDLIESVIQSCGGDARAAVRELLLDADFLRGEIYTASRLLSRGIARGWRPRYGRV